MADVLKKGSDWLMAKLKSKAGQSVSILRKGVTQTVTATLGSTIHDQDDGLGGIIQWESRDFLIDAAEYSFGGVVSEPQRGDRVAYVDGSTTHTYEVLGDRGLPPWRWSDAFHTKYRVHTKQVLTA